MYWKSYPKCAGGFPGKKDAFAVKHTSFQYDGVTRILYDVTQIHNNM
jgi:hypothetical protein